MRHLQTCAIPVARTWFTFAVLVGPAMLPSGACAQGAARERPEELIVTSSIIEQPRRQIGTAVATIDSQDIELRGYHELADVLRTLTGISASNSGGPGKSTALRIRGEESFRTLLMIDGVKAVDVSAPQVAPSFDSLLTTSDVQRVEVLRGPQGFIYGADAGGVVSVLTKRGAGEFGGQAGLEYGDYGTRKLDAGISGGSAQGDYFVAATDLKTDGFNSRTADTVLRDDDGADNTTLHTKLGWNVSPNLRLQLVVRNIDALAMYDGCFSPTTFATVHECTSTTDQTTSKVSADFRSGVFSNEFGYSNIDIVRNDFAEGARAFGSAGEFARFEYTGSYQPSDALTLVYGLDLQSEKLVGDTETFDRNQNGYYVEYQQAFDDSLFVTLGARYDDNDDFGQHTSTRVSGAYVQDLSGSRSIKYRASYGTGFRAPSLYEISYNRGPFAFPPAAGFGLQEENSTGYDVGLDYDAANGVHFEITYFDQDITDEIVFDLAGFSGYLQSSGRSRSKGVEIGTEIPLGESFEVVANWTNNDTADSTNQQRLRRPQNVGNIGLLYRKPGDRLQFIANYRLSRDSLDAGAVSLDDYEVLDLSGKYRFTEQFELYGRIQNATGEDYQEVFGYNTAGRSTYVGVRIRF